MDKNDIGFHVHHCCVLHGCKYNYDDKDCPVANLQVKQNGSCEHCGLESEGYYGEEAKRRSEIWSWREEHDKRKKETEMIDDKTIETTNEEMNKLFSERFDKTIVGKEDQLEFQKKIDEGFFDPKIKVKKLHPDAVLPKNAHEGDAGYDLVAADDGTFGEGGRYIEYKTGLAVQTPQGFHTCIYPRSSISKYDLVLANSIGLLDEIYRGEVILRFKVMRPTFPKIYRKGEKIGQLVIVKTENMPFEWADELDKTERGHGGFGSTGK